MIKFEHKVELEDDVLEVLVTESSSKLAVYAYYLYYYEKNGATKEILVKQNYIPKKYFSFKLKKSGYYFVKLFAEDVTGRVSVDSNTVLFINDDTIREFEETIKGSCITENTITDAIDYQKFPTPSNDYCVIHSKSAINTTKLESWLSENTFLIEKIDNKVLRNNYIISSTKGVQLGINSGLNNSKYVYTGYAFANNKLYFGQQSMPENFDISEVYYSTGAFNLVNITEHSIRFTNDYLGLSKYFYYIDNEISVICNKYHMLLLVLNKLGVKLKLDENSTLLNFVSNVTLLRQTMIDRLLVENTSMINLNYEIVIDKDGLHLIEKPIVEVLNSKPEFNEELYKSLIKEGANDIINNVKAVLDTDYKYKVCELSGGKDSRFNFAALQNIEGSKDKVQIYSCEHEPNDLSVAIGINNLYDFDYFEDGYNYKVKNIKEYIKMDRSYYLGHHYLWYIQNKHQNNIDKIVLNANSAEAYCTSYYSESLLKYANCNYDSDMNEVVKKMSLLISKQSFASYNELADLFETEFRKVLEQSAGSSPMEKFDNSLLYYRGTIHASSFNKIYYEQPIVIPAQSKALLKAKQMWFGRFDTPIIIYDLLNELSPKLANAEFNSAKNNENYEKYRKYQFCTPDDFKEKRTELNKNDTKWTHSYENNMKNTTYFFEDKNDRVFTGKEIEQVVYDNIILAIKKLHSISNEVFDRLIVIPSFYFIKTEKNNVDEMRLLHNKLNSLLDVLDIIGVDSL